LRNLTRNIGNDGSPVWSPSGRRVAFVSDREGNDEVYVMSVGGGNLRNLTRRAGDDGAPAWSPGGKRIAFVSGLRGERGVYVVDADGRRKRNVSPGAAGAPAWSPDGRRIAFERRVSLGGGVVFFNVDVVHLDGSRELRLVEGREPRWSPDGRTIAFVDNREIYVVNANSYSEARNLTRSPSKDGWFAWSPTRSR
jgi:TolB protein